jgi:hypothetical protein
VLAGTHFGGCGFGPLLSADAIPAVVSRIIPVNRRVMTRRMEHPPASQNSSPLKTPSKETGPRADARTSVLIVRTGQPQFIRWRQRLLPGSNDNKTPEVQA